MYAEICSGLHAEADTHLSVTFEAGQRARVEYPLTPMGKALALPFMAMTEWGDQWLGEPPSPLTLRSKAGRKVTVGYVDDRGKAVPRSDVETVIDADAVKSRRK